MIGSTIPELIQIPLIKKAGFDGFFTTYNGSEPIEEWAGAARQNHLEFETVHGPFRYANRIWEGGKTGREYLAYLRTIIDACRNIGVNRCILHVTVGNTAPDISEESLSLLGELCDYAKAKGVHICFENLEPLPHIDAVMEYIDDPFHGFCWDCGHNACYTPHIDMLKKFGSRLQCLHIHDNLGVTQPGNIDYRDDRHFLPFDGILDWNWFAGKLAEYHYTGPVTLEVSVLGKPEYRQMSPERYLALAYERGCRLREMLAGAAGQN